MNQFQTWYRTQPRAIRALLTINVVLYLLWIVIFSNISATASFVYEHLALNPDIPGILFEPWQLITYNFLHLSPGFGGLLHILFNMLWLVWIGREFEDLRGSHTLLAVYLIGGVGGALLTVLLHAIFPGAEMFAATVHGASASVLGVMTAVATAYPHKSIALLFIGTVRLVYVVIAFLVLDILFAQGTSISAHLGGALFGFLFAKAEAGGADLSSWTRIFFSSPRQRKQPKRASRSRATATADDDLGTLARLEQWLSQRNKDSGKEQPKRRPRIYPFQSSGSEDDDPVETSESEVDRILDKISEQGYDALTEEEKRILYEASRK